MAQTRPYPPRAPRVFTQGPVTIQVMRHVGLWSNDPRSYTQVCVQTTNPATVGFEIGAVLRKAAGKYTPAWVKRNRTPGETPTCEVFWEDGEMVAVRVAEVPAAVEFQVAE
jgi:hypothetical protein